MVETVFSEYEVYRQGFIFPGVGEGDAESIVVKCIGKSEEALDVKTVSKNCRGSVAKERTKGAGSGTLKITLHCPVGLFRKIYGMSAEGLADGVWAYGKNCLHPTFATTQLVKDEDDNVKYKAYPACTVKSGMARTVENGGDIVEEIELEISITPDDDDQCMYEALAADITDESIKEKWMSDFSSDLIKKKAA